MLTEFSKLIRVYKLKYPLLIDVNIHVESDDFSIHANVFNNKMDKEDFIFVLRIGENKITKEGKDPCIDYSYGNGKVNYLPNSKNVYYIDLRNGDNEADEWLSQIEAIQISESINIDFKKSNSKNRI